MFNRSCALNSAENRLKPTHFNAAAPFYLLVPGFWNTRNVEGIHKHERTQAQDSRIKPRTAATKTQATNMSTLRQCLLLWSVDYWNLEVMADNVFKSHDIGLRAQKKILSRMATKNIAKTFIDGTTASLLDNLYRLCKLHTGNKAKAEKLIKNIIKIVIKIGVLHRNNQFSDEELQKAENFKRKFQNTQLSIISFYEVDFTFDLAYLQKSIAESQVALKSIVQPHLTEKSLGRIDEVFDFFGEATLLETAFRSDSPYREVMGKIVADINAAMEMGDI